MALNLQLKQTQHLVLTPQLQQAIRVLQLPTLDLLQEIQTALEENPFLEAAESGEQQTQDTEFDREASEPESETWESGSTFEGDVFDLTATPSGFRDYLMTQLGCLKLPEEEVAIITWLIGSLDDEGFLTEDVETLRTASPLADTTSVAQWRLALKRLQAFDPAGVAAGSLQERLYIQLQDKAGQVSEEIFRLSLRVVEDGLELLSRKKYTELQQLLKCPAEALKDALSLIETLDPHPMSAWQDISVEYVVPELEVRKVGGEWKVALLNRFLPELRLNELYAENVRSVKNERDRELWMGKLSEARLFLKSIRQRHQTMLLVAEEIVRTQQKFFDEGISALRPLVHREVAEALGIHESTVSRVANGKYLQCPRGIFELKCFFSSKASTRNDSAEVSSAAVQEKIKELIERENPKKPLSDQALCDALKADNVLIARRTVAKYRELLEIPPASQRKKL
jgi:RNA polymerase sigma-54 factor